MRNVKTVISALVLATAVGGTALAADSSVSAGNSIQATTQHDAAKVKHKVVKHKKTGHKKSGTATTPAANAAR